MSNDGGPAEVLWKAKRQRRRSRYGGWVDGCHVTLSRPWGELSAAEQQAIRDMIAAVKGTT